MRRARCADAGLVGAAVAAILLAASPARGEKSGVRPNVISVPSGPGTISGLGEQFEPTLNTGSATYAVNLDVPPGTAGLAPGLALHYDSGQGDGIVGIGWSFDVGAIQRQTDHGVPRYGATDRFLWNGQELVPVAPGVFRLKIEGAFLRFRQAADHWEADARDGTTYRFGVSSSARVSGPDGGVFRWALEQVVDVSGNKIAFSYEADSAQIYPTRIDYNARTGAAQNSVRFEYESRKDAITDYRAGFGITTARRLKRVRMMVGEARVRRYELAYLPDTPASVLSRLGSVTMFGTDDTTALPTLSFGYSDFDPAKSQVQGLSNPPAFSLRDANTELDDFDGDGLPDLVHTELGHHVVALNQGDGWGTPTTLAASPSVQLAATGTELGDLDGDGIPDLIAKLAPGAGDFVYFPNRGAGKWEDAVRFQNNPAFSFEDPGVRMLDFDGDGLVDAMQTTPTQYYYWRNNGDGTWSAPISGSPIADQAVLFSDAQVRLVDMNGDRLLDLVYVTSGSLTYWPSLGWGHWGTAVRVSGAPDAGADQPKVQLADVNGDGLSDAVLASGTEARMWLQRGDGSFAAPVAFTGVPEANPATTVVRLGDINGTGTIDLIWNAPDAAAARVWRYLDLTGGVRPNLLTTIANGLGRTIEIAYSSSGAMYRMAAAAGMPWSVRLPIPTQVVASVTTSDGRGWSKQEAFVYRDGYFDGPTRQFRGFGQATRMEPGNDEEATSVQVHRFDVGATDEALRGVELGFEVQTATGSVLARESFGYDVHLFELGTDGRRVAGPDRRWHVVDHVEGTATPRSTREEWTYDDFGDVLVHSEWGVIDETNLLAENDERITTTEYASDTDRWLLGRPTHATVTNAAGARLSETFTYYDGDPFVGLPFGRLGPRGLPTRTEAWVEGDRLVQTTRLQRDEFGLVTAMLDPRGSRREVDYDVATHCFPIAERSLLEGGRKLELTAGYDPTTGTLSWYKDAAGRQTSFHYNPLLQLSSIVRAGDSDAKPTVAFDYLYGNPLSQIVTRSRAQVGAAALLEKHHYYDGLGRDLGLVEEAPGGKTVTSGLKIFGPNGRVVREFEPTFTSGFDLVDAPKGLAFTAHRYDALGRQFRSVLPDGTASETRYAPLRVEHWDAEDLDPRSKHKDTPRVEHLNALGIAQVDEDLGGKILETQFERDALGRITTVLDAALNTTTHDFDGLGRLRGITHPDAGKITNVYDDAGNLTTRTDARKATVVTTYDAVNRPTTETLTDAAGKVEETVTYHYDDPSPKFPNDKLAAGELTWVEDAAGVEHYRHDERDRLAEMLRVIDGKTYHLGLGYDDLDRLAKVTYPDGRALDYHYDERGHLREVPGILRDVQYDERAMPTRREYANGAVTTAQYDALDRLQTLATMAAGGMVQSLTYGYDAVGNVTSITDGVRGSGSGSETRAYGYDDLYRLRTASGAGKTWTYDFDDLGNWLTKSDLGAFVPGSKPHQPATAAGRALVFDDAGQLTERPGSKQTFDAKGRLSTVTLADGTVVRYRYDYSGAHSVKEVSGPRGAHRTVYIDRLAEERDGALVDYVFAGGLRIARLGGAPPSAIMAGLVAVPPALGGGGTLAVLLAGLLGVLHPRVRRRARGLAALGMCALVVSGTLSGCGSGAGAAGGLAGAVYYHQDHLQGVAFETGEHGEVLASSSYDPFGGALAATTDPYAFSGKERDPDTGLYDFGARAYDPKLGMFLSPDPAIVANPELAVADPQLLSPYSYVRNNPASHVDPDGRFPHIVLGALVGAAIGGGAYLIKAAITKDFSVKGALAATAGGAVAGAVAAATGGASLLVQGVASGIAGGVTQRAIETKSLSATLNPKAVAVDAALGVAGGLAAKGVTAVARRAAPVVKAALARRHSIPVPRAAPSESFAMVATGSEPGSFVSAKQEIAAEVDAAFANGRVRSGTMVQFSDAGGPLSGSGPKNGTGSIWYHDNIKVPGAGPGGKTVEVRTHSPNPNAPPGSYSSTNYTTQINTSDGRYLLPDGSWKTIPEMTNPERASAHYPAGN
jgi:RHS repeat-associated protein